MLSRMLSIQRFLNPGSQLIVAGPQALACDACCKSAPNTWLYVYLTEYVSCGGLGVRSEELLRWCAVGVLYAARQPCGKVPSCTCVLRSPSSRLCRTFLNLPKFYLKSQNLCLLCRMWVLNSAVDLHPTGGPCEKRACCQTLTMCSFDGPFSCFQTSKSHCGSTGGRNIIP